MRLSMLFISTAFVLAGTSTAIPVERENMLVARFGDSDFLAKVEARAYDKLYARAPVKSWLSRGDPNTSSDSSSEPDGQNRNIVLPSRRRKRMRFVNSGTTLESSPHSSESRMRFVQRLSTLTRPVPRTRFVNSGTTLVSSPHSSESRMRFIQRLRTRPVPRIRLPDSGTSSPYSSESSTRSSSPEPHSSGSSTRSSSPEPHSSGSSTRSSTPLSHYPSSTTFS